MSTQNNRAKLKVISKKNSSSSQVQNDSKDPNKSSAWLQEMMKIHPYMSKLIKDHPSDPQRFVCILCSDNNKLNNEGMKEIVSCQRGWLKRHFQSPTHNNYLVMPDEKAWMEEINQFLGKKKAEEEVKSPKDNQNAEEIKNDTQEKTIISQELESQTFPLSKVTETELLLKIARFLIVNNLPFEAGPKLLDFVQEMISCYNINLIRKVHTSRPMITDLIRYGFGYTLQTQLFNQLKSSKFSIIFDGSSDIFGGKYLGILVRYLNSKKGKVSTKIIAILEVKGNTTGESLYNMIRERFCEFDKTILHNLIGLCSDNASNCISSKDAGCANRFIAEYPGVVHFRDLCHSYNLICEHSIKACPLYIIDFIKKICSHFNTGLRANEFEEIQRNLGIEEPLKILKFKEIRWLSLEQCTHRVLLLWNSLMEYFKLHDSGLKSCFEEPEYKLYSQLLYILLHKLNSYNVEFQKAQLFLDHVLFKIKEGYLLFSKMLFKPNLENLTFEEIRKIEFGEIGSKSYQQHVATDDEFLEKLLHRYSILKELLEEAMEKRPGIRREFIRTAKTFIIDCILTMEKKLPFDDNILNKFQTIFLDGNFNMTDWKDLASMFKNVITIEDLIDFQEELERFEIQYQLICKNHYNSGCSVIATWEKLSSTYPNLAKLAKAIFVLPYSSALVESTFSKLKLFKTPYRSRISAENLESSLIVNQHFKEEDPIISEEMIKNCFRASEIKALGQTTIIKSKEILPEEKMNIEEPKVSIQALDSDYPSEFLKSTQPFLNMLYKSWIEHQGLSTNSEIEKNNI